MPMPPLFFESPLRQIIEPFVGRLPVIAQILDIYQSPAAIAMAQSSKFDWRCQGKE
jgi:hypothetical protein